MEGGFTLHGNTKAKYNGGAWSVSGQKATKSEDCGACPPGKTCVHVTGTLVSNYQASVAVSLPAVPAGLSKCQTEAAKRFIATTLKAHELDHKSRFESYNGTTSQAIDMTGCGVADLTAQIKAIHDAEAQQRADDANALSAQIDPFMATVESDCEE
jgi:hypothetical protein